MEDVYKAWEKMVLNSSYGFSLVPDVSAVFDKKKSNQITEFGRKNLEFLKKKINEN